MLENWRRKFLRQDMRQISVWTHREHADQLQQDFSKIGENTQRGAMLRSALSWVHTRRRPLKAAFHGNPLTLEVDLPTFQVGEKRAPAGGRIYGDGSTLIELDPHEAAQLENALQEAISPILVAWLDEKGLKNQVRNGTGVVVDVKELVPNSTSDLVNPPKPPKTDAEFAESESLIQQKFEYSAFHNRAILPIDPSIYLYHGFWNTPSACRLVHGRFEEKICVGFVHLRWSGTSPTNYIEHLAYEIHTKYYAKMSPDSIYWYDIWSADEKVSSLVFNRVIFELGFSRPQWDRKPPPKSFESRVYDVVAEGKAAEIDAYMEANKSKGWKHRLEQAVREKFYSPYHADILIDDEPKVAAVAMLGSWPRGHAKYGKPYLFISRPGEYDFRHKASCDGLIHHWKSEANILTKGDVIESWDDPDLVAFCRKCDLPLEEARLHYTGEDATSGVASS